MPQQLFKPYKCPEKLLDKIQIRQVPNCELKFTTCELGKSIWKKISPNDFTFYDPHNRESPADYNPLLDPFLKHFFMRKVHLNHLRKNNFITEKNEVFCSLKDFNGYRKLLHRIKTCAKETENVHDSKNRCNISRLMFEKKENKNIAGEYPRTEQGSDRCLPENPMRYDNVIELIKLRKLEQECQRMTKFMAGIDKYNNRMNEIQEQQKLNKSKLAERAFQHSIEIAKKQIFVAEKQRKRKIEIKKKISAQNKAIREKKINIRPEKICLVVKCPLEIN